MTSISRLFATNALIATSLLAAVGTANAASLVLNSDIAAYYLNDGTTMNHAVQSTTINGPGSGSVNNSLSLTNPTNGGTIVGEQKINATLTGSGGTVNFNDGWRTNNLPAGQITFWNGVSTYSFNLSSAATLSVNWTAKKPSKNNLNTSCRG